MSTQVQFRRGTTSEHATFTGASGELTVDTDKETVVVHDGAQAGGYPLLRQDMNNIPSGTITSTMIANGTIVNEDISGTAEIAVSKLADGSARQLLQTDAAGTGVEWTSNVDVPGTLDVTGAATFDSSVTVQGDLTVNGTTTTIDTQNLSVEDKNIEIGKVSTPSNTTADGGGITLKGATDKTLNWVNATGSWTSSENLNLASGKTYKIDGTDVISATALGSAVQISSSNIPSGTVTNDDLAGSIADSKLNTISTANKVNLAALDIDGGTDIGAAIVDADLFIVDDAGAGTNRKAAASRITDYTFNKVSGDVTIASNGTAAIGTGVIVNADISASAAIDKTKISGTAITAADTGTVTSTMIADGTIVNEDISGAAEIAVSKLADGAARQLLQTDAAGTGVEWTNNVDVPGTLDVTGAATFDSPITVQGDLTINSTTTTTTTLQLITPTANRTISFPDATGTVGLVAGSSGQLVYNNAGAYAGAPSTSVGATGNITLSLAGAASTPPVSLTGTWFSGGTSTTTKPQLLIEPVGTTSTAWSTSGTGLGVNAASGFAGRLLDLQVNGTSTFNVSSAGSVTAASFIPTTSTVPTNGLYLPSANNVAISTNGTGKLFIGANGFVGLGATSPAGILHVAGVNPQNVYIENIDDQIANVGALIYRMSGQNVAQIQAERVDVNGRGTHLKFSTAQINTGTLTERLRIDSSGRVGVGTTSPDQVLSVQGLISIKATDGVTRGLVGSPSWDTSYFAVQNGTIAQSPANAALYQNSTGATTINSASGYSLTFTIGQGEKARIDSSGRLLVGTSTARVSASHTARLQVEGSDFNTSAVSITSTEGGTFGASLHLGKLRGSSAVSSNDTVGRIQFNGFDGSALIAAAHISAQVDGTPGADDMPGRLVFSTTADGAASPTERMRIDSDGNIGFGDAGYDLGRANTVSINPSEGLIGFGMDGRNTLVTGTSGSYIFSGGPAGGDFDAGDLILQSRSNQNRNIVFATGATPAVRMTIAGTGNVDVVGAFSKGSGSFKIDHPLPEKRDTHHLVHSFIEGPQADLIYRGHISLVEGVATVNLDEAARMTEGTFEALCTNVCCFTSNESDWTPVRGHVSGNILTIKAQDLTSTAKVCWMVVGERKDQHMLDTDWTDENGRVITEPLKTP